MELAPDRYRFVLKRPIAGTPGLHWGYNGGATTMTPGRREDPKPLTTSAVIVLGLIALGQFLRVILRWEVTLNGAVVPVWLSGIAFVVAGGLALMVWRERRR